MTQHHIKWRNPHSSKYAGKVILAPMVRVGTLPIRLLSLEYGADLVYCEELIDFKLLRSIRNVNDALGTIDFIDKTDGTVVFRTCDAEKKQVILQLGTSDPQRALAAAKLLEDDVSGIDVNMGCPKEFSIKGGMGVALMENQDKACEILRTLTSNVKIPVTCKVRVLPDIEQTLEFCRKLQDTGIAALAVHGRTKDERPQHFNRNSFIKRISEELTIPVIANGGSKEIETFKDIQIFRNATGASSVMLARAAEWNCSIFRQSGKLPLDDVISAFLRLAVRYDNAPANTKYCVQNMLKELQESPRGKKFLESQTLEQICELWDLGDYCRKQQQSLRDRGLRGRREVAPSMFEPRIKQRKSGLDAETIQLSCAFLRSNFASDNELPKTQLLMWTRKKGIEQPVYRTEQEDKLFQSVVTVGGKSYCSSFWEKNKRWAEQGAAIVCLVSLGLLDRERLIKAGSLL